MLRGVPMPVPIYPTRAEIASGAITGADRRRSHRLAVPPSWALV